MGGRHIVVCCKIAKNYDVMDNDLQPNSRHFDFLAGGGEMGERMRALDWAKTPLGPAAHWPQSLKTIVRVMLDSRYAMWMLWGPELTFFCNDAYLPTVGMKRDWVLGARSDKVWEEIWPDIGPRIQRVLEEGRATWDEGLPLFLERYGFPEESYHTFSYSPIYDDASRIAGMLCVVTEVTERVIGERRLRVLRDLAASPRAETTEEACKRLIDVLANNPLDVSFASLYLLDQTQERLELAHYFGDLPEQLLPAQIALADRSGPWPIGEAIRSGAPQIVELPAQRTRIHYCAALAGSRPSGDGLTRQAGLLDEHRGVDRRAFRRAVRWTMAIEDSSISRPAVRRRDCRRPDLRGGAGTRRGAGGNRSREDRLLLERVA